MADQAGSTATQTSADQHAIAVAVEAVLRFDCVPVRVEDALAPGKRCHHCEQARTRQMKIGEQLTHDAKRLARVDENPRFGFCLSDRVAARGKPFGSIFEGAHYRGTHGEHQAPFAHCSYDCSGRNFGYFVSFLVNGVIFDAFGAYGLESAEADFKSDLRNLNPALPQLRQNFRGEMQTCRRSRDGAALTRVDGLIALAIHGFVGTLDVWRKRNVAQASERFVEAVLRREMQDAEAILAASFDNSFQLTLIVFLFIGAEDDALAHLDFSPGPDEHFPVLRGQLPNEKQFDE